MYIWLILVDGLVITIIIVVDKPLDGQFSGATNEGGNGVGKWENLFPKWQQQESENCSKQLDRQEMGTVTEQVNLTNAFPSDWK